MQQNEDNKNMNLQYRYVNMQQNEDNKNNLDNNFIEMSSRKHHHKHQDCEIKNLDIIENEVEKKMTNPQQSSYCHCNICQSKLEFANQKNKQFIKQTSSTMRINPHKLQQFFKLVGSFSSKVFLKMDIPEICFFYKGQPRVYYRSNNLGIHKIDINMYNKKNLLNMFMENHKLNQSLKNNTKTSDSKSNLGVMAPHIKNLDTVVPRFKCGEQRQINRPKNFIFHNNPNFQDATGENNPSQSEQICLVKYKQKGFQLLTQKALKNTLRSLLILQNVDYIQSYIKPHEQDDQIYQVNYKAIDGPINQLMFSRSLTQIKMDINLINKLSKDYIPPQHIQNYEAMLRDSPNDYCLYQNYKMIHYIQLIRDVKVSKLSSAWVRDCTSQLCFIGLTDFEWTENQKINVDVGEIQQLKELINTELTDFQQQLLKAWENMKARKQKPQVKPQMDIRKQQEIAKIRKESSMRMQNQKSKLHRKTAGVDRKSPSIFSRT